MNLRPGAVYVDRQTGEMICIVESRPKGHPKGMHLDSAIALPVRDEPTPGRVVLIWHPFEVVIVCPELTNHGALRFEERGTRMFEIPSDEAAKIKRAGGELPPTAAAFVTELRGRTGARAR